MKDYFFVLSLTWTACLWTLCQAVTRSGIHNCEHPPVPLYAQVSLSDEQLRPGTIATYKCDPGYELFGSETRRCSDQGRWSGDLPYCAVNVAYGKPSNQSSTVRGGEARNANDGDLTSLHESRFCSETKVESSPWWQVDLLQPYEIRVVRLLSRSCCGHQPLHDLEIRVGNSSNVQGNRLCAWYPGTLDDGITKDFQCAHPIVGRYVYIQMVGMEASLSLCEVFVFTTKEFSAERCGSEMEQQKLISFNQTCYEFQAERGGSFTQASDYCQERNGLLLHSVDNVTHNFLHFELERLKLKLKSRLVWLGARREIKNNSAALTFHRSRSNVWKWVNGRQIQKFLWADDQPNNYNGEQNCIVLDGGRHWYWNDVTCELDYLPWICVYTPTSCGSPDKQSNSTLTLRGQKIGAHAHYKCPSGSVLLGDQTRICQPTGFWSGMAPACRHVDCGLLADIEHGRVQMKHSYFNSTALYECDNDYLLVGSPLRVCQANGSWSYSEPKCVYKWCSQLGALPNGQLTVSNRTVDGIASYTCNKGHKLIGVRERRCLLGGKWTGEEPLCKYIDCGLPSQPQHGRHRLLSDSTTYESEIEYECDPNHTLIGNATRVCTDLGTWSGVEPTCKLINCGRPEVPAGVEMIGDRFTINSIVQFRCKAGYRHLDGDLNIRCTTDSSWQGTAPTCKYVDCGRVPILLKGEVKYLNQSTYLGSLLQYTCSSGYRLTGLPLRQCNEDGKWTGSSAKCEEIRCSSPEMPANASVVFAGNDRTSSDSFKIGSTVQYRCSSGHTLHGQSLRTCELDASWTGKPPTCHYVDCGLPLVIPNGQWLLTSNSTHYGSTVEYECQSGFRLIGAGRRICLENGTWSSGAPSCELIQCGRPELADQRVRLTGSGWTIGSRAHFECDFGHVLVGPNEAECESNGKWSFPHVPFCRLVDCGRPPALPDGRGQLLNGSTTFDSVVQYSCLPEFRMIGDQLRRCLHTGEWSGTAPRCLQLSVINELDHNSLDASDSEKSNMTVDGSRTIGVAAALCLLLLLLMTITVLCLKSSKKPQPVKNTENVEPARVGDKDSATVMSYSRLSLESEAHSAQLLHRHHPNGLVTFSASQPIYANSRPPPPLPGRAGALQAMLGENTTPRFMNSSDSSTLDV